MSLNLQIAARALAKRRKGETPEQTARYAASRKRAADKWYAKSKRTVVVRCCDCSNDVAKTRNTLDAIRRRGGDIACNSCQRDRRAENARYRAQRVKEFNLLMTDMITDLAPTMVEVDIVVTEGWEI